MLVLGFDPGGIKSFGWATLHITDEGSVTALKAGVASSAPEAVRNAGASASEMPVAAGIDAPLFWVQEGDRRADAHLRKRVVAAGGQSGTVSSVNSLRGACLVQGVLTARLVTISWPSIIVTEAHPKALLRLHAGARAFVTEQVSTSLEEHARDAALAAYAAWAAVMRISRWRNLVLAEASPFFPTGKEVAYWFPE